jgi:hypothetical protein
VVSRGRKLTLEILVTLFEIGGPMPKIVPL